MNRQIRPAAASVFIAFSCFSSVAFCQEADTTKNPLSTVEVKAYGQARKLKDVPAAVGFVNQQTLNRFGSASVVQAVNTVAGVRMEERSPGSYRFNIRGSSLRSPFGVRNVKVYVNDIPFTDPGGNTYLNGLGYYNVGSIEILKGPGSSLYGAGTGGVLLIESTTAGERANLSGEYSAGSFGLRNAYASVTAGKTDNKSRIGFQHQVSDGYRYHSKMKRDVLSWTGNYRSSEKQAIKTTVLYSDLFYETPGALTKAEYTANPKAFRPRGAGFPSAEQAKASISQKTFLAGASLTQQLTSSLSNLSSAYGAFTELRNPTIRNFGKTMEPHVGGRTVFSVKKQIAQTLLNVLFGGELQQNFSTSAVFKNVGGEPDSLQSDDEIHTRQSFAFLQANASFGSLEVTAGASLNGSTLRFRRSAPTPGRVMNRTLNNQLTPRLAIARKWTNLTLYSSVSKGFSPPTSAELLPSGSDINFSLQAEEGVNYDLGARGTILSDLTFDINAFYFRLQNTIVQRRDAGGGDYFVNAGKTSQKGVETSLAYSFFQKASFFRKGSVWLNHTYHDFHYKDFKQLAVDFSGKALPGIAPNTVSTGVEVFAKNGLLANLTYYYSSKIPLNDANSDYANAYHLLGAKFGLEKHVGNRTQFKLVVGADNLLDQHYSLGNDINGFGGRYYNAAAGRNFYASLIVQLAPAE
ncbi:TonB-dependent receptor [Flavisolibacter nicotianae]|uniref:TonB-dependent receptor n=1 Tax=Flavisolibacter nicotianae TaxID=2364882 RepID=UPI000EAEB416|nr:TonB-dependent receptor plug domain-containing protein [Flavisolibacter nicotianae]